MPKSQNFEKKNQAGEVVYIQCLLHRYQDLSSNLSTQVKNPKLQHTSNSSVVGEWRPDDHGAHCPTNQVKFLSSRFREILFQSIRWGRVEDDTDRSLVQHIHTITIAKRTYGILKKKRD